MRAIILLLWSDPWTALVCAAKWALRLLAG
jgi:hypothetical protein